MTLSSTTFVGRQRELAQLTVALDEATSGRGRLVMLVGEPGIGKTRLVKELAGIAEHRGARIFWGSCYEQQGAPPYWPWLQPLRAYFQRSEPDELLSHLGSSVSVIAEIVPELHDKLSDLEPPSSMEPESARFRLFDAIAGFLKNVSADRPLVVVLDDLHWADGPSLLLLEFIVHEITDSSLLLIGTYRDVDVTRSHPLSKSLGTLVREQQFSSVELKGLNQQEVGQLAEGTTGARLEGSILEAVHGRTDGNPFFVGEIARLLGREGADNEASGWDVRIPSGIRDVVGRRLDRLSEECNRILTTASVIGREFDFRLLNALSEEGNDDELLEVIDEALQSHVIEEVQGSTERYQFTHALVQQTLSDELSTSRKVRLHARIGEALEKMHAANFESFATELAFHFSEAQTLLGGEKLVRYSIMAGEQALAVYAHEEALAYFQAALEGKDSPIEDAELGTILFGLGRAQATALLMQTRVDAVGILRRAFDVFVASGDTDRAVAAAIYPYGMHSFGNTEMTTQALTLVPPDSVEAGYILSRYGMALDYEHGDHEGAQKAFEKAVAIARREGEVGLELRTLVSASHVDALQLRYKESLEKDLRSIELASQVDQAADEAHAHFEVAQVLFATGDLDGATRHAAATKAPAERSHMRFWTVQALTINQVVASGKGEWSAARDFSDRGLSLAPGDMELLAAAVLVDYETGEFTKGEANLERLLEVVRHFESTRPPRIYAIAALIFPLIARMNGDSSLLAFAEDASNIALSIPSVPLIDVLPARMGMALIAAEKGEAATAQKQYSGIAPMGGTISLRGAFVAVDRVLGLLAQTMGQLEQASAHFDAALTLCRNGGYRPESAWCCYDCASLLHAEGDRERALDLLAEAETITAELGMRPLNEKVLELRERVESLRASAPPYPDGLTEREVEVLRLVAAGRTDREIADELFISIRTASTHVRNILNKTDSANRAEAATYAGRHDLV